MQEDFCRLKRFRLLTSDNLSTNYKKRLTNNFQNNGKNQIWIN
jgi:hypothetical protein